jgi:hypothetical protein
MDKETKTVAITLGVSAGIVALIFYLQNQPGSLYYPTCEQVENLVI